MKKLFKTDIVKEIKKDQLIYSSHFYERLKKIFIEDIEPPFSISIEGEWGTGKTFLMKLLMKELAKEEFPCIWFNPWEYETDNNVFLAFLQKLSQEFSSKFKGIIKQLGIFNLLLFTSGLDAFGKIISNGSISYESVKNIVSDIDDSFKKTFEKYEDVQTRIKKDFVAITNDIYKSQNKPLVIFFDDLDRCLPENTLNLIESLKNYFNVTNAKAIFVFGQNPKITRDFIKQKYNHISDQFVNDYYKKVFDFCVDLPYLTTTNIESYINYKFENNEYIQILDKLKINKDNLKQNLIKRNFNFKNKSLRVIDKILFSVLFFSDYLKILDLDFIIFWFFSKEIKPFFHDLMINSIFNNEKKNFSEVSSVFDKIDEANFEKSLYKEYIQKYNYLKNKLIIESLLCVK